MRPAVQLSIIGDKGLLKTFAKMPTNLQKKYVRKGIRIGGNIILARVKANLMQLGSKNGAFRVLARGMKLRALKRSRKQFGVKVMTPPRAELGQGPAKVLPHYKGYWPVHVEYGFFHIGGQYIEPVPYIRSAFDLEKEKVIAAIDKSVRNGVTAEWLQRGR